MGREQVTAVLSAIDVAHRDERFDAVFGPGPMPGQRRVHPLDAFPHCGHRVRDRQRKILVCMDPGLGAGVVSDVPRTGTKILGQTPTRERYRGEATDVCFAQSAVVRIPSRSALS
jgi:hypothetical protein